MKKKNRCVVIGVCMMCLCFGIFSGCEGEGKNGEASSGSEIQEEERTTKSTPEADAEDKESKIAGVKEQNNPEEKDTSVSESVGEVIRESGAADEAGVAGNRGETEKAAAGDTVSDMANPGMDDEGGEEDLPVLQPGGSETPGGLRTKEKEQEEAKKGQDIKTGSEIQTGTEQKENKENKKETGNDDSSHKDGSVELELPFVPVK